MSFRDRCFHGIHLSQPCELCNAEEIGDRDEQIRQQGYNDALRLVLQSFDLDVDPDRPGVAAVANRVEDKIRQQERARVAELEQECDERVKRVQDEHKHRMQGEARSVFLRMREEMRLLGVDKWHSVEFWARELGIDLEGTDG